MKNRLYQIIFKEIRPFLFFFSLLHRTSSFIVDKSKNCFALVDNRRRLILNRLNKFANIERYWKIIGKFHCLERCMKMVIDNKTG